MELFISVITASQVGLPICQFVSYSIAILNSTVQALIQFKKSKTHWHSVKHFYNRIQILPNAIRPKKIRSLEKICPPGVLARGSPRSLGYSLLCVFLGKVPDESAQGHQGNLRLVLPCPQCVQGFAIRMPDGYRIPFAAGL